MSYDLLLKFLIKNPDNTFKILKHSVMLATDDTILKELFFYCEGRTNYPRTIILSNDAVPYRGRVMPGVVDIIKEVDNNNSLNIIKYIDDKAEHTMSYIHMRDRFSRFSYDQKECFMDLIDKHTVSLSKYVPKYGRTTPINIITARELLKINITKPVYEVLFPAVYKNPINLSNIIFKQNKDFAYYRDLDLISLVNDRGNNRVLTDAAEIVATMVPYERINHYDDIEEAMRLIDYSTFLRELGFCFAPLNSQFFLEFLMFRQHVIEVYHSLRYKYPDLTLSDLCICGYLKEKEY